MNGTLLQNGNVLVELCALCRREIPRSQCGDSEILQEAVEPRHPVSRNN